VLLKLKLSAEKIMDNIFLPNDQFDFSQLSLAHPSGIQGGAYFTKIQMNGKPLYIETPKSLTRQGFVKNGKKIYCDLMFDNNDEQLIHWLENLENKCQELIYKKGESWFENKLEMNDIETAFASPMRIYKSGKYYLVRVNVKMNYITNTPLIKIFNESEMPVMLDEVVPENYIITILEIQGIKFTSKNFQLEMELKQVMVVNTEQIFENCLIKSRLHQQNLQKETIQENFSGSGLLVKKSTTPVNNLEEKQESISDLEKHEVEFHEVEEVPLLDFSINEAEAENDELKEVEPELEVEQEPEPDTELTEIKIEVETLSNDENENENLTEVKLPTEFTDLETITLKKPNEVYYEIYKTARKKAKEAKKTAIMAFLEAKNIKKTYMLDDLEDSEDSDMDIENLSEVSENDLEE